MPKSNASPLDALNAQRDAAKGGTVSPTGSESPYVQYGDADPLPRVIGAPVGITRHADDDNDTPVPFVQSGKSRRVDLSAAIIGVGSVDPALLSQKGKAYRKTLLGG